MNESEQLLKRYIQYYEDFSGGSIESLRDLVSTDFHFVDPFNDINGAEEVILTFSHLLKKVQDPKFIINDSMSQDEILLVRWTFLFKVRLLFWQKPGTIEGMSFIRADKEKGKVIEHIDHWDASTQVYMKIPIIGHILSLLRKIIG